MAPEIRRRCPDALIQQFIHIPWPQADAWRVLPASIRERLIEGLLSCDIVAFHTEQFARNFVLTCQELLDLHVDMERLTITVGDRSWRRAGTRLVTPTISSTGRSASRLRKQRIEERSPRVPHRPCRPHHLSKNILRGFKAFDQLLDDHPELSGRVTFLALLQPSRQDVEEYVDYVDRIRRLVADINLKHGNAEWQPIVLQMGDSWPRALAAYRQYDVLVVNSVFDGMNLVAKEGVLLNRRDGVLLLSEHAGVHEELGAFALTVHPFDIGALADAMYEAITMPRDERRGRLEACAEVVRGNDLAKWLRVQLNDIDAVEAARAHERTVDEVDLREPTRSPN